MIITSSSPRLGFARKGHEREGGGGSKLKNPILKVLWHGYFLEQHIGIFCTLLDLHSIVGAPYSQIRSGKVLLGTSLKALVILITSRIPGLILTCFTSLTCGTTWHAAGLLGKLRSSAAETKLSIYSVELYSTLEQETGVGTGMRYLVYLDCTVTVVILASAEVVSVSSAIEVNENLRRPIVTFKPEAFA